MGLVPEFPDLGLPDEEEKGKKIQLKRTKVEGKFRRDVSGETEMEAISNLDGLT